MFYREADSYTILAISYLKCLVKVKGFVHEILKIFIQGYENAILKKGKLN